MQKRDQSFSTPENDGLPCISNSLHELQNNFEGEDK